jgi:hypothetical protein
MQHQSLAAHDDAAGTSELDPHQVPVTGSHN